jgi:hypothetical protein
MPGIHVLSERTAKVTGDPAAHTKMAEARPASEATVVVTTEQAFSATEAQSSSKSEGGAMGVAIQKPPADARPVRHPSSWAFGQVRSFLFGREAAGTSTGRHGEVAPKVADPGGYQEPPWFGSNTFRLSPEPWDLETYAGFRSAPAQD